MAEKKSAPTAATVQNANTNQHLQTTTDGVQIQGISSAAQQIDSGVVHLEIAYDLFQVLFDAAENEFTPVHPKDPMEEIAANRFNMYLSAATILQSSIAEAMKELQAGRNQLYLRVRDTK